jgi:GAF domain-containing protein
VARLRFSITWRLVFWFLFLSLIPTGAIFALIQRQVRENIITVQTENVRNHARLYYTRLQSEPDKPTEIAIDMMSRLEGDTFFLIGSNGVYLAHSNPQKVGQSASQDISFENLQKLLARETTTIRDDQNGVLLGSYRTSLTEPLAVSISSINEKTLALTRFPQDILLIFMAALAITALGAGIAVNSTVNPLRRISEYANEVSGGNLNATLDDQRWHGEIALLSFRVKNAVASFKTTIANIKKDIESRTIEFERRSSQLKAVADVGKAITSFRNLSELLEQATHLINENFGFYHVGIFLLDEHREYAVLSASNSEGGKRMLEKKHQLKVGETGIVGYVTQNAKARIALDVGEDAVYFNNPDLPRTRSEMALPLVVGGQTLGALDVQSTESQAFSEEDVATLQVLAEQLAVAIQNANLLRETEKALESARMGYGEMSREAWGKILREQPRIGFLSTPPGTTQMHSEVVEANIAKAFETGDVVLGADNLTISVPIRIRGQSVGAIRLKKSEIAEAWTQDETNLAIALSDQLSGALESARLYNESQQRAARETLVSDISAQISTSSHTEAIIRETVQELGQAIGKVSVTFQLLGPLDGAQKSENGTPSSGRKVSD